MAITYMKDIKMKNRILQTSLAMVMTIAISIMMTTPASADFLTGLVAQWDFNGNADDSSGNNNNGTVIGATYVPSPMGQALSFDGMNDYVNMGNSSTLKPTQNITIAMWIKPGATQNPYADILGGHQNDQGYVVQQNYDNPANPDNLYYFAYFNGGSWQGGAITTELTAGVWQLFVVQKEGNTIRHYVNGEITAEGVVSGDIHYHPGEPFYVGIGWYLYSGRYFNGSIDKVMIWGTVVPVTELDPETEVGGEVYPNNTPVVASIVTGSVVVLAGAGILLRRRFLVK
jgi:hypothetical protein